MKVMTCLISFPAARNKIGAIRKPASIRIESTFKEFVSKAEIVLPRNIALFDKLNIRETFKRGDRVLIDFGYGGEMVREYEGYVTEVSADYPITIKCQDEMWKLRSVPVNFSAQSTTLGTLLNSICKGYTVDALEGVALVKVVLQKTTVGAVLNTLQSDYGLYSYMNGKTLVCGKYYSDNTSDPIETLNLDRGIKGNNLTYRSGADIVVKFKGSCITSKGLKLEYETGEEGGDEYSLSYTRCESKADLKRKVDLDYEIKKLGGYEGTVTSYGDPYFKHGRKVILSSSIFPERAGRYYIDGVVKDYNESGLSQELTLGGLSNG